MTEAVATNGHNLPPAGNPVGNPPPAASMQPGFVPVPNVPGNQPDPAPAPAKTEAPGDADPLANALAQLTAALAAQNKTQPDPAPGAADDESLNNFDPKTLEDPVLRSMASAMQVAGKGLDMDRIFSRAIESGNPELLDIAYIKEKAGDSADDLITIARGIIDGVNREAGAAQQAVYTAAGGEANWNACTAAFNKGAPDSLKQAVAALLNSGDKKQIVGAAELVVQYAKGMGHVPNPAALVQNGAASVPTAQALSKSDFQTELRKLNENDRNYLQQREALFARRRAGIQLGM